MYIKKYSNQRIIEILYDDFSEKVLLEKFEKFKLVMNSKNDNKKRRKEQLVLHTGILFADEIDYLYDLRKEIRKFGALAFTYDFYLFEWMGYKNVLKYHDFKKGLANVLIEIAKTKYSDFQVKHMIAYVLSEFFKKVYINYI